MLCSKIFMTISKLGNKHIKSDLLQHEHKMYQILYIITHATIQCHGYRNNLLFAFYSNKTTECFYFNADTSSS